MTPDSQPELSEPSPPAPAIPQPPAVPRLPAGMIPPRQTAPQAAPPPPAVPGFQIAPPADVPKSNQFFKMAKPVATPPPPPPAPADATGNRFFTIPNPVPMSTPLPVPPAPAAPAEPELMLSRPAGSFMEGILAAAREDAAADADTQQDSLTSILDKISSFDTSQLAGDIAAADCHIAPKELPDGTKLHGYRLLRTIGSGGFGVTYLAQESLLNRTVVIKENFPDSLCYREEGTLNILMHNPETGKQGFDWALNNFLREVRLLATLDHPCIAKVYSYFEEHGTAYYVIEYINGISLGKLAYQHAERGRPIPQSGLVGLMVRLLDALDYLHSKQILHRDIKPDNILVTKVGLPVIIDFGAARESYGDLSDSVVETPGFSPSEQSTPHGNMGPWTDLYAFGATLYYILTGTCLPSCQQRELFDTVDPLATNQELLQHYNPALLATIDRAIEPLPTRRYQCVAEWMQDIAAIRL